MVSGSRDPVNYFQSSRSNFGSVTWTACPAPLARRFQHDVARGHDHRALVHRGLDCGLRPVFDHQEDLPDTQWPGFEARAEGS